MNKRIFALFLSLILILSCAGCAKDKNGAANTENGENAVVKAELKSGTPKAPGDIFNAPKLEGESNTLKLGEITKQAYANDSITVTGMGFKQGDMKAYVYSQSDAANAKTQEAKITVTEDQTATVILPEGTEYGIHGIYLENAGGKSNVLYVNKPKVWWTSETAVYGGSTLKIFGENLTTDNKDKAYAYLLSDDGKYCELKITYADPYKIEATVPTGLANGKEYTVMIHNGHGGDIGFAKAEDKVKYYGKNPYIYDGKVHNVTDYGADPKDAANDDTKAIKKAIDKAKDGDIIYFPTGVYKITTTLFLDKKIKLEGVDTDRTVLIAGDSIGSTMFETSLGTIEFCDIKFYDVTTNVIERSIIKFKGTSSTTDLLNLYIHDCEFIQETLRMNSPDHAVIILEDTSNIRIENNKFKVSKIVHIYKVDKIFMNNNLYISTGFAYGTNYSTNATMIWAVNGFEASDNEMYAKNASQTEAQPLKTGDYTAGRALVFQQTVNNTYIKGNKMIGFGNPDENCGEVILYENGNALFFDYATSATESTVSFNSANAKAVYEDYLLVVTAGKGKGQVRIADGGYDNKTKTVKLKEDWAIVPDSTSLISVVHQSGYNAAIHKNKIDAYTNYAENPGATTSIQMYANNYNFFITDNEFSNMTWGLCLSPAFSTTDLGVPRICGMYWIIVDGNDISNACAGVRVVQAITEANKDLNFEVSTGVSIRKNSFHDFKKFAKGSYESYPGGTGIYLGSISANSFLTNGKDFMNTYVIENNTFANCPTEDIRLMNHQYNTILRNNTNGGNPLKVTVDPGCHGAITVS